MEKLGEWRGIETAPKDGTRILVCLRRGGYVGIYSWDEGLHWIDDEGKFLVIDPEFWMPLPAAPRPAGEEGK